MSIGNWTAPQYSYINAYGVLIVIAACTGSEKGIFAAENFMAIEEERKFRLMKFRHVKYLQSGKFVYMQFRHQQFHNRKYDKKIMKIVLLC